MLNGYTFLSSKFARKWSLVFTGRYEDSDADLEFFEYFEFSSCLQINTSQHVNETLD